MAKPNTHHIADLCEVEHAVDVPSKCPMPPPSSVVCSGDVKDLQVQLDNHDPKVLLQVRSGSQTKHTIAHLTLHGDTPDVREYNT